jgi:hypothetical protein
VLRHRAAASAAPVSAMLIAIAAPKIPPARCLIVAAS